jgi:hypothetical protein
MHRVSRSALSLCTAAVFVACGGKGGAQTPADSGKICQQSSDCLGTEVCVAKQCVPTCHSTAECGSQGVGLVCEEGQCVAPACGSSAECTGAGQACISGACKSAVAASQVASCEVTPGIASVHTGAAAHFKAVALDGNGEALVFNDFTWTASAGAIDASGALTSAAPGDITVTATVHGSSKTCTSTAHSYAAAASFRVTVINMLTKEPVAGAKVVIDGAASGLSTLSDGTVTTTVSAGAHDVHVFAAGYNYTSFIQTSSTDLLVPLPPWFSSSMRSGFTSHMCDATKADDPLNGDPNCPAAGDFTPLQDQGQAVHLAFFGSGIPNCLLDLSIDTLVGPLHSVTISIAGKTLPVNLPYGLVLGVGSNFFGTNDYRVFADPGVRALWGIGGNLNLATVVGIITPLLGSGGAGNVDIGTLLPQLLGSFGKMQAGAVVGVKAPPNPPLGGTPTFDSSKPVALGTRMRLGATATSPKLPTLDGNYLDGVLAVVGAMDYPVGFVPLGLTAGLSAKDGHGGVLDPTCDTSAGTAPCDTNKLPIKFAAENGGTEGSKIGIALLAVNFGGLSANATSKIAISGQVKVVDSVPYTKPGDPPPSYSLPDFMTLPASASIVVTGSTRNVTVPASAQANVYRFELENGARLNWNLWMPPGGTGASGITLPDPTRFNVTATSLPCDATSELCDPFADAKDNNGVVRHSSARILSMQLAGSPTADQLESFGALRLDELGTALQAFTALQVNIQ